MVKQQKKHSRKKHSSKGFKANCAMGFSLKYDNASIYLSNLGSLCRDRVKCRQVLIPKRKKHLKKNSKRSSA